MKKKVALITDSVASLPAEIKQRFDVKIMPLNISFNGKLYRDGVDLSPAEAYRMLQEKPEQFFASPASIGEYLKIFRETAETAEGILCITLSSRLSGMNNAARLAISQYLEDSPQVPVELLDSRNAAAGEGLIVSAAIEASLSGKDLAEVSRICSGSQREGQCGGSFGNHPLRLSDRSGSQIDRQVRLIFEYSAVNYDS